MLNPSLLQQSLKALLSGPAVQFLGLPPSWPTGSFCNWAKVKGPEPRLDLKDWSLCSVIHNTELWERDPIRFSLRVGPGLAG
jgi:hypothetical protein